MLFFVQGVILHPVRYYTRHTVYCGRGQPSHQWSFLKYGIPTLELPLGEDTLAFIRPCGSNLNVVCTTKMLAHLHVVTWMCGALLSARILAHAKDDHAAAACDEHQLCVWL